MITKQDLVTLGIGILIGGAFLVLDAGANLSALTDVNPKWLLSIGTGFVTGAARYTITFLVTHGFTRFDSTPPNQLRVKADPDAYTGRGFKH